MTDINDEFGLDDEDETDEEPGEETVTPRCNSHSGNHRWKKITVPGAMASIFFCGNCRIFDPEDLNAQIKNLLKQNLEILEATQMELYATQEKLNTALSDVSGYKSDLEHKQKELDNVRLDKIVKQANDQESELQEMHRHLLSAQRREEIIDKELQRALGALSAIVPYMDRAAFPEADAVALYAHLAHRSHKLHTKLRQLFPAHEAWMQGDGFTLAHLILGTAQSNQEIVDNFRRVLGDTSLDKPSPKTMLSLLKDILR